MPTHRHLPGRLLSAGAALALMVPLAPPVWADDPRPDQAVFRELYQQLVETNTTLSQGDCTLAARRMAARLQQAGFTEADLHVIIPEGEPRFGALVATLPGSDSKAKAVLLLAHIDVVEAKREDWQRDPFTLVEEGGYFYGRGSSDDKAMAAVFTDLMIRLKSQGFVGRRPLKLALTCGEETPDRFNSVSTLVHSQPQLLDAAFGLNEGAAGRLDHDGHPLALEIQAGEKVYQDFSFEVTNPGGHSSRPRPDNAIYQLAAGLGRLAAYQFPISFNPVTKAYFTAMAKVTPGAIAADLAVAGGDRPDPAALARVARDPGWNSMMRTTCVATMVDAGHAANALAQRARATVNCRILPGVAVDAVLQTLRQVVNDPAISVSLAGEVSPSSPPPPLSPQIMAPVIAVSEKLWPGVPVIPTMATGATDGRFLNAAGIPVYGLSGMFRDPDGNGVHGLNERIRVRSLYDGRDFLTEVVKLYARQS
jgi:acetylornithine deacetylase/succinyl-diaminopimelate desuccinylase-like protein